MPPDPHHPLALGKNSKLVKFKNDDDTHSAHQLDPEWIRMSKKIIRMNMFITDQPLETKFRWCPGLHYSQGATLLDWGGLC